MICAVHHNRDQLILDHLDMVRPIVAELMRRWPSVRRLGFEEAESAGRVGLINAADLFDPEYGVLFSTYANRAVRSAIMDEVRRSDVVRYPRRRPLAEKPATHSLAEDYVLTDPIPEWEEIDGDEELLHILVEKLPPRHREVVQLRVGLTGDRTPHTHPEIAALLGLSAGHVGFLWRQALAMLREQLAAR